MIVPEEDMPDVAKAAREVVQEAREAGVWLFSGGLESQRASVVATDGTVTDGPYPETKEVLGGFAASTSPHARKRSSGPPRSSSHAAVRKRYGSCCPSRPSDRTAR